MSTEPINPMEHLSPDAIVAYVLKEPMSEQALADYIVHSMMLCVPCGRVTATVTTLAAHGRWSREELVERARALLRVVADDPGSPFA